MRIEISDVSETTSEGLRVSFRTAIGTGIGTWKSNRWSPSPTETFHVEFDIDEAIKKGKNASPAQKKVEAISFHGDHVLLTGYIEAIDPDRIGYFRLARDCLTFDV